LLLKYFIQKIAQENVPEIEKRSCLHYRNANARIFGDLDDSNSEVSKLLAANKSTVLLPNANTKPNVYYINKFDVKE